MKQQIIVIHGGSTFSTYGKYLSCLKKYKIDFEWYRLNKADWKKTLGKTLGKKFEVILPEMPNKRNVKYIEWKIWFEKFIPYIRPNVILIGHSLGGTFLAKYLSENKFSKKIKAVFFIAPPYNGRLRDLLAADFKLPKSLVKLQKQSGKIFIYHSKDDKIVPFAEFEKYQKSLPSAIKRIYTQKGHFNQEKFPELVKDIKNL
ncbi:alpha/beta hydrolase [Candidatus Wolfebacteria bacterium]|nr:alpha/beta hydrolase [Candidatus Wolfebacteria bacterium]